MIAQQTMCLRLVAIAQRGIDPRLTVEPPSKPFEAVGR
jgi:hypothetical protein